MSKKSTQVNSIYKSLQTGLLPNHYLWHLFIFITFFLEISQSSSVQLSQFIFITCEVFCGFFDSKKYVKSRNFFLVISLNFKFQNLRLNFNKFKPKISNTCILWFFWLNLKYMTFKKLRFLSFSNFLNFQISKFTQIQKLRACSTLWLKKKSIQNKNRKERLLNILKSQKGHKYRWKMKIPIYNIYNTNE